MDAPQELAERKQWVCWGADKIPFQTNGQPAKSSDPATWNTLEACQATNGQFLGIGFVFSESDPLVGIDLDNCIDPWTRSIDPWALEVIEACNSYAEFSPSGNGIHIFCRGELPGGKGRKLTVSGNKKIELYDRGRYFTFTGMSLTDDPLQITECQSVFQEIIDKYCPPAPPPPAPPPASTSSEPAAANTVQRAIEYLKTMPPAIEGSDGSGAMMKVAAVLIRGFCLNDQQAFHAVADWNATCQPPWSEKELQHKFDSARKKSDGDYGFLKNAEFQAFLDPMIDISAIVKKAEESQKATLAPAIINVIEDDEDDDDLMPDEKPAEFPMECLDGLPGVLREAYHYTLATAIKPQPIITLGAMISLFATVFGRKVRDDYNTRTNIMLLCLAPSGSGKEHPRAVNKQLLAEAGLDDLSGPERVGSHAGIVSAMAAHPTRLFQLDEIGRLLVTMRSPGANPHLYNIGSVLMQLYSSSHQPWTGDAYADLEKTKKIIQPHLCVYGTSVPESFYGSLSMENLTDGLLGRMLVFESESFVARRKPLEMPLPANVLDVMRFWRALVLEDQGNLPNAIGKLILAEKTPEADARHEWYCNEVDARHEKEDSIAQALWARAPEKAAKLALIYACCEAEVLRPVITEEAIRWGQKLANYSTRLVIQSVSNTVASSKYEAEKKRVWRAIKNGDTQNQVSRKTQWLKARERSEIIADLVMAGLLRIDEIATKTKTKTVFNKTRESMK